MSPVAANHLRNIKNNSVDRRQREKWRFVTYQVFYIHQSNQQFF